VSCGNAFRIRNERFATMGNVFDLDSLREEIEREYAPFVLQAGEQEFTLQSLLRVPRKVRDAVIERLKTLDTKEGKDVEVDDLDEDGTVEAIQFILSSVTKDNKGRGLIKVLGDDMVLLMKIMQKWQEATQPGEAQDSPN
jgi:hypothetical protein